MPTRLLDLYPKVLELTENTIDMLRAGISVKQLPILYQEAVVITRRLGIRYLWIDSLCIIQRQKISKDSNWLREASMMGTVYSNSYCNIAAMDAEDSLGQCFFKRQARDVRPHEVIVEWHGNGPMPFYLIDERSMETGFSEDKPLSKRAWVLQEQLLAPRALLFGKTQVHWQCRTHTACETFPLGLPESREGQALLKTSVSESPGFWLSWKTIVEAYSRRSLTFSTDKLAAIAGVASVLERKDRLSYDPDTKTRKYIAPSWSWASVEGEIEYSYKQDWEISGDNHIGFVEDAEVITVDGTPTGPIKSGWIQVKGPLIEQPGGWSDRDDEGVPLPKTVYYLTMFELFTDQRVWGLSLKKIEEGPNEGCYERIGTFSRYFEYGFGDTEEARAHKQRLFERWTRGEERLVKIV
ncbi:HET-domain-containing protein [Cadophora sp. DSE1049]|nr:HET-domain-containing protein [Cadophora sp. DSE1049]